MVFKNETILWFMGYNEKSYSNRFFRTIENDSNIREALTSENTCYIIYGYEQFDSDLMDELLKKCDKVRYISSYSFKDKLLQRCSKLMKTATVQNLTLDICCLLSGQRTGSTLIIDCIQKMSENTLALSEIFLNYGGYFRYKNSYDVKNENGILYGYDVVFDNEMKCEDYFKQFEDFAIYRGCKNLVFKLTLSFDSKCSEFWRLDSILQFISKFKVLYLQRNDLECYISTKLAGVYGYSNIEYDKNISNGFFNLIELNSFHENKEIYMRKIYQYLTPHKYIFYKDIISNNDIAGNINSIFNGIFQIDIINNLASPSILNKKQNTIGVNYYLDSNFWS